MGLLTAKDLDVFKGKQLIDWRWDGANENVVYLEDKDGYVDRVRIPKYIKDLMVDYCELSS